MDEKNWVLVNPDGNHWKGGFYMARPLVESEYTVTTGCLKTHQYGGHFTMSMSHYEEMPAHAAQRVIEAVEKEREAAKG